MSERGTRLQAVLRLAQAERDRQTKSTTVDTDDPSLYTKRERYFITQELLKPRPRSDRYDTYDDSYTEYNPWCFNLINNLCCC